MDECGICLQVKESRNSVTLAECKHSFHKKCIQLLIINSMYEPQCPYCRRKFNKKTLSFKTNENRDLNFFRLRRLREILRL